MQHFTTKAVAEGFIEPPEWLPKSVVYETLRGSHAYGADTPESDTDVLGICVPPKEIVFPHLAGEIMGFGRQKKRFREFGSVQFESDQFGDLSGELDLSVLSIVFFFHECMDNQPNRLETLYSPEHCVLTSTKVSEHMRDNRDLFLHQGAMWRFTGFAKSQIAKMRKKDRSEKRLFKYGYNAVRMVLEGEQIIKEGTLVLDDKVDTLLAVREGDWTFDEIEEFCDQKETELREIYDTENAAVPYRPNEDAIKTLLLECLEEYYGSLDGCIRFSQWS